MRSLLHLKEREDTMTSPDISTGEPQTPVAMPGRRWIDRMLGSDPGLNRLRSAALAVITIGLILAAEALFVRLTHALQVPGGAALPAAEAARAASADHEGLVVMMMMGALVGLNSAFGVNDAKAKGQLVTMLLLPVPLVAALAVGLSLASATFHRSMDTVADAMTGPRQGVYVRSSSLYDRAERSHQDSAAGTGQECLPIQDLKLIDGAMASLAQSMRLEVTDLDTVRAAWPRR